MAGLFVFAFAWELTGMRGAGPSRRLDSSVRRLAHRVGGRRFTPANFAGAGVGALAAFAVVPVAPGRLAPLMAIALVVAGFLAPDAWAERAARHRRRATVAALPDALDLVAVGTSAGRSPVALFSEIANGTVGPLAAELALVVAEIEAGARQPDALSALRDRSGLPELGAVGAAIERSRRYGSPLAEQLHRQAATLRTQEQRRIEERAARAAPKIQLVVAMVLVPSALLAIAAALVAHSDSLFSAF